jgi:hypothetical protein
MKIIKTSYMYELIDHVPLFERKSFIEAGEEIPPAKEYILTIDEDGVKADVITYDGETIRFFSVSHYATAMERTWKEGISFLNSLQEKGIIKDYNWRMNLDTGKFDYYATLTKDDISDVDSIKLMSMIEKHGYASAIDRNRLTIYGKPFGYDTAALVSFTKFSE